MQIEKLSLNTATLKPCTLQQVVDLCVANDIPAIGPWRDKVQEVGVEHAAKMIHSAGLKVSGLCRGGFFVADNNHNWDDNKKAIDEAAVLKADCLVIVAGGMIAGNKNLADTHKYIQEGLEKMTEYGKQVGVPIALEPLHPMYAADRCSINTLGHALDICEAIGEGIGVAIDAYHVWWDPDLDNQIKRAGEQNRILGYHVCDWRVPTTDMLLDRGMMGDGAIDLKTLSQKVTSAGYEGFVEVEIFSERLWKEAPETVVKRTMEQFVKAV